MRDRKEFFDIIRQIDGCDFSEYAQIVGDYDFTRFILKLSDMQPDAESGPTLFLVTVPQHVAGFPAHLFSTPIRRTALEDVLTRKVTAKIDEYARFNTCGVAVRRLSISRPAPQILPRSSLGVSDDSVELRIEVNMPSLNGNVHGESLCDIFFENLPDMIDSSLVYCNLDREELVQAVTLMEQADQIRQLLPTQGLVSMVADGTTIPAGRVYGETVQFSVDDSTMTALDVPEYGMVKGLGIPAGITLLLGSEKRGRRALLKAVADGIYNHKQGDGRELCVTVPDAVYVAQAPGRSVQHVDLSPFVSSRGEGSYSVCSADAFTSQAASTIEALTAGARVLVFDESDSAPGFLSSDSRLSPLMAETQDEYVSLSRRAREIVDSLGVSLVIGGAYAVADLIAVADTVLYLNDGMVYNITQRAREGFNGAPAPAPAVDIATLVDKVRWIVPSSVDPSVGIHDAKTRSESIETLHFGRSVIDLSDVCQIADQAQTETIGLILEYAKQRYLEQPRPLREVLDLVDRDLSTEGLECLTRELRCDMARPRRYEIAAAINRLRTLRVTDAPEYA